MIETKPLLERLADKVLVGDGCWEWTGSQHPEGYGSVRLPDGRTLNAHRAVYELVVGPIPAGITLDHLCRNRVCVNPSHMDPVTRTENVMRGEGPPARNARKTECLNGHPLEGPDADVYTGRGKRECNRCRRERRRAVRPPS